MHLRGRELIKEISCHLPPYRITRYLTTLPRGKHRVGKEINSPEDTRWLPWP